VWSPDGASIAYVGQTNDNRSILTVVHPDGTDPTLLPIPAGSSISTERPIWAPDSRSLVTTVSVSVGSAAPGGTLTRFPVPTPENSDSQTATIGSERDVDGPAWASSPDGSLIAYEGQCGTTTPNQLCVVDTRTGSVRSLDPNGPSRWSLSFAR
jgi:Tol biopolymer transport system component